MKKLLKLLAVLSAFVMIAASCGSDAADPVATTPDRDGEFVWD